MRCTWASASGAASRHPLLTCSAVMRSPVPAYQARSPASWKRKGSPLARSTTARGGPHEHPPAAGVVGDRPALDDEGLKRAHEGVVVDGIEGRGPESACEGGTRPCAGHIRELGQSREVHGYGQAPFDLQPARDVDGLLVSQGVPQGDEQLRAGILVADVLRLVDVDGHHDVPVSDRRAADLDEEPGESGVGLGAVLGAHGQRDAGGGDHLDSAQKIADALLPGGGEVRCG